MASPSQVDRDLGVSARVTLCVLALAAICATIFFAWGTPLTPGRMNHPSAELIPRLPFWSFLASHRPAFLDDPRPVAALLLASFFAAFGACALGIRLLWNRGSSRATNATIFVTAILCLVVMWVAPPNLNSNLWNYMMRGSIAAAHGANPYTTAADEFPDDPLYPYANHAYTGYPGGKLAVWMMCDIAFARLGAGDPVRTLLVYRTALFLMAIGNIALVFVLARRLSPRFAAAGTLLWSWNPIVIVNSLARADPLMILLFLLGVLLIVRGRRALAVAPITLSVYVKMLTAPLLGVAALAELRARRWRTLILGVVFAALATIAAWGPFYAGNARELVTGYAEVAGEAEGSVHGVTKEVAVAGFALLILVVGLTRRPGDAKHLLEGMILVQIYFSIFFAKFASADYLMTLIALVAILMNLKFLLVTFALTLSFFLFDEWYLVGSKDFPMPDLFPFPRSVVFLLPPIAAALFLLIRLGRRRFRQTATP